MFSIHLVRLYLGSVFIGRMNYRTGIIARCSVGRGEEWKSLKVELLNGGRSGLEASIAMCVAFIQYFRRLPTHA